MKRSRRSGRLLLAGIALLLLLPSNSVLAAEKDAFDPQAFKPASAYVRRTFVHHGKTIDEVVVPGRPPRLYRAVAVKLPVPHPSAGTNVIANVPAFDWCYGCSATSAAMMMGHYDNASYGNMYAGPTNGGVCPMTNATWGSGECPLSATHMGYDGLATRGHVDNYWIEFGSTAPDPFITNGWPEHTHADCTADFMGTNQSSVSCTDGSTTFYFYGDGSPLYDYTGCEPDKRDGCHGVRLFAESRAYTVVTNFSQRIHGYEGNTIGFTYSQYKAEIDAGRPVMIQVAGHSMVGVGYNTTGNIVYLHDTWDHQQHEMTWGGSYSGMEHYGVTVIRLQVDTLGISVTPAEFEFGFVDPNATVDSDGQALVIRNTGNVAEDVGLRIKVQDDRNEWTAGTPAQNVYTLSCRLCAVIGTFVSGDVLTTVVQWCNGTKFGGGGHNMAPDATINQWFQFKAPTAVSGTHAKSEHAITVEVSCQKSP